ncbi:glycosyltransferase family 2 protein, partial [Vibrio cholerae]|nr:glycosyltransferase family 2 protein [Vibrio cholerae]
MSKLTIVIPVFNSQYFIHDIFSKIPNVQEVSYIFVDDGSVDDSYNIIKEAINKSPFSNSFSLIRKSNGGVSSARNIGLKYASSEFILFLDSDDYLISGVLDEILEKIDRLNKDVYIFEYVKVKTRDYYIKPDRYTERNISLEEYISGRLIDRVSVCSCVYSVSFLKKNDIKFDCNYKYAEDQLFLCQTLAVGNSIYFPGYKILAYYNNNSSAMNNYSDSRFDIIRFLDVCDKNGWSKSFEMIERRNEELINILTIYSKCNGLFASFLFYKNRIKNGL